MRNRKSHLKYLPVHQHRCWLRQSATKRLLFFTYFISLDLYALPVTEQAGESISSLFILLLVLGTISLGVIVVAMLILWSQKQDHIKNMAVFCMRSLVSHPDERERCEAARSLSQAKDPAVLLTLVDILMDEKTEEPLRNVTRESLSELSKRYQKYRDVIQDILSAQEQNNRQNIIEILKKQFEGSVRKHVQSAIIIGRLTYQLGHYNDAREWLWIADQRNNRKILYHYKIRYLIQICNERILQQGDSLFKEGKYIEAHERYAALFHHLTDEQKQDFALHLREACVYCRLGYFEEANQSLLLALQDGHGIDISMELKHALDENGVIERKPSGVVDAIDHQVSNIMESLVVTAEGKT